MTVRSIAAASTLMAFFIASPAMAQTEDVPAPAADLVARQQPAPQPPGRVVQPAPRPGVAQPQPPQPAPPQAVPVAPPRKRQSVNIRVEMTITEQQGTAAPVKKTVTSVTADGMRGSIRSSASTFVYGNFRDIPLNVDVFPEILPDGKIQLGATLEYDIYANLSPQATPENNTTRAADRTSIRENLALILENDKSVIAAHTVDPRSDRQVTIEVKATILK